MADPTELIKRLSDARADLASQKAAWHARVNDLTADNTTLMSENASLKAENEALRAVPPPAPVEVPPSTDLDALSGLIEGLAGDIKDLNIEG